MKKLRRLAAVAMACAMTVTAVLAGTEGKETYAEELARSGKAGANATWALAEDGTLTISGTGDMDGYEFFVPYKVRPEVKKTVIQDGITSIDGCSWFANLEEVTTSNSVKKINWYGFAGNEKLTKVSLSNSLIEIEYKAFYNCSSLPEVTVPGSVTQIGEGAFSDCSGLKKVKLSNNVTTVAYETFYNCSSLPEVTVPYSVDSIEGKAFGGCSSLTTVNFEGDAPKFAEDAFKGVTATVYYPLENSTWTAEKKQNYGGNLTWVAKSLKESLAIVPEGTNSEYALGSTEGVTIQSNGPLKYFTGISVDGKVLSEADYKLDIGSNSIIILSKYLNGLATGDHVVALNYTYGSVSTVLKIQNKAAATGENSKTVAGGNPKTADESNVMAWITVAMLSAGCLCLVTKKKRKLD